MSWPIMTTYQNKEANDLLCIWLIIHYHIDTYLVHEGHNITQLLDYVLWDRL